MGQHPRKKKDLSPIQKALLFGRKVVDVYKDMPNRIRETSALDAANRAARGKDVAQMDSILNAAGIEIAREPWQAGAQSSGPTPYYKRVRALERMGKDAMTYRLNEDDRESSMRGKRKRSK